jgi:hypothetical protein
MLRYVACLAIAALLILAGVLYVRQVEHSVGERIRRELREAKAAGKLPSEIDPEADDLAGVGVPLPASEIRRIELAHLLVAWRVVLIPLVALGSVTIAYLLKRRRP